MSFEKAGGGPGEGIFPSLRRVRVRFTDNAVAGDHMMFNLNSTTLTFGMGGAPGSDVLNTVVDYTATSGGAVSESSYFYGLAEETQAAASDGWVTIRGIFEDANATAAITFGDGCVPDATAAGRMLEATGATGKKVIAIATELTVSNFCRVLFNGIEGFGHDG